MIEVIISRLRGNQVYRNIRFCSLIPILFFSNLFIFSVSTETMEHFGEEPSNSEDYNIQDAMDDFSKSELYSELRGDQYASQYFEENKGPKYTYLANLPQHDPIIITNNSGFINNSDWVGLGTIEDPFTFSGYSINTNGTPGINISNTNVHFLVENVWVNGSLNLNTGGFHFDNVTNGQIINTTVTQSTSGYFLSSSRDISLINNSATGNPSYGFFLSNASNNNTLTNNIVSGSTTGLFLTNSLNNTLINNSVISGTNGFYLNHSDSNYLANNSAFMSTTGLHLSNSDSNYLTNNSATDGGTGYFLGGSRFNTLDNNHAIRNSQVGFNLLVSRSNDFTQNFVFGSGDAGFILGGSDANLFTNNTAWSNLYGFSFPLNSDNNVLRNNNILENSNYGIILLPSCTMNHIEKNLFSENNGIDSQAYDNSTANVFTFNYWNDWTTPDNDNNLIVDFPYNIEGIANNTDKYPLVNFARLQFITLIGSSESTYQKSGTTIDVDVTLPFLLDQIKYNWDGGFNSTIVLGSTTSHNFSTGLPSSSSEHTLAVFAQDNFTNWHSQQFHFIRDDDKPNITNSDLTNNTNQKSGYVIKISVDDDLAGISRVWYTWDNNGTIHDLYDPYGVPLISPEGMHILTIYTNDTAGNIAEVVLSFNTDDTPPDIVLSNLVNGSVYRSGTLITLMITGTDQNLTYNWDFGINETVLVPFQPEIPSSEGSHLLSLHISDSAGNWKSTIFSFICDNTAPDIVLSSPEHNAILPSRSLINLTISDQNRIINVLFRWDNTENSTLEAPYDVLLITGSGEHVLTIYAQDEAGNWGKANFVFTTSDNSSDSFLLVFGIIGIIILISGIFLYIRAGKWRGKLEHVLVLTKSGLPLYSRSFHEKELKADVVLAGGALVGISFLSSEITQASRVKVIKQENYCIMLEEGVYIVLAVMIRTEVKSLRKRMMRFISEFEATNEELLKAELNDSEEFPSAESLVDKHFVN